MLTMVLAVAMVLSLAVGAATNRMVVAEGPDWVPIDYRRDVVAGSALDFSAFGSVDAPAGRHGWLRNVNGRFEFENAPGVRRKFCGVNLCNSATTCSHEQADRLTDRLVRLGYNAIRIHHHDGLFAVYTNGELRVQAANAERMDYLIAAAIRRGIYVTTDLYVSRPVTWRQVGVDRDGKVPCGVYKSFVGHHPGIRKDWRAFARLFLEHVNPHTGRRYADEPGLPLLSLVNEGAITMYWEGVRKEPLVREAWREWLAERRQADGTRYGRVPDDPAGTQADSWKGGGTPTWHEEVCEFAAWLERANFTCERDFVRALGAKALLTSVNYYARSKDFRALRTELFDYADNHFYVDHPSTHDGVSTVPMLSPAKKLPHELASSASARAPGLPLVNTEWNWCPPGRYRNGSGLLAGAMAALQDWDGLWRFDYSSHEYTIDHDYHLTNFQLALDPVTLLSDRAAICLFLRGDLSAEPQDVTEDPQAAGDLLRRRAAFDATNGSYAIVTPRTCGVFAESGERSAGILSARIEGSPAAVWASVVDGSASLAAAGRLLVAHLTDAASEGAVFSGERLNTQEKPGGSRVLARTGRVEIRLILDRPADCEVWALATDGARRARLPVRTEGGVLTFMADVARDRTDATFLYEVVRLKRRRGFGMSAEASVGSKARRRPLRTASRRHGKAVSFRQGANAVSRASSLAERA